MTNVYDTALIVVLLLNAMAVTFAALVGWQNNHKLNEISTQTDGKMSELLDEVRKSSLRRGIEIGQNQADPKDPT